MAGACQDRQGAHPESLSSGRGEVGGGWAGASGGATWENCEPAQKAVGRVARGTPKHQAKLGEPLKAKGVRSTSCVRSFVHSFLLQCLLYASPDSACWATHSTEPNRKILPPGIHLSEWEAVSKDERANQQCFG